MADKLLASQNISFIELSAKLDEAIENSNIRLLNKVLKDIDSADLALYLSELNNENKKLYLELIKYKFQGELFLKFNGDISSQYIALLGIENSAKIIAKLESPEIISLLDDIDESIRRDLFDALPKKIKLELKAGLTYPIDSLGRLMHKNFISVPAHWTINQVNKYCVKHKNIISDKFYGVFVIDHLFKPIGLVSAKKLVINDVNEKVSNIMSQDVFSFNYLVNKEQASIDFQKYDINISPVTNNDGRIIGFVTIDDMIEVIDKTAQEDIFRLGGINAPDIYSKFSKTLIQRFPWLFINLLTAIIASVVIAFFDDAIERLVTLAVLMPIIASMGGNAGTQTVTVAVRALATKELNAQNTFRIIKKELLMGFTNGLFFGIFCALIIYLLYSDYYLSILFAIATIVTLTIAGFSGAIIPIVIFKLKGDPAIGSSVLLTTITDVIALFVFLGLASLFI